MNPILPCIEFTRFASSLSVYLYASALFAFLGSVVDLVPILALSNSRNRALLDGSFRTFFITRGTLFSLTIGFKFLFFWAFVGQPVKCGQLSKDSAQNDNLMPRESRHSASWGRWGIIGLMLKWVLLALILAITVLQILWRNVTRLQKSLYFVSAAVEAVVAALFMLKIALNVLVSSNRVKYTVLFYLAPLFCLGIIVSLSVTNIVICEHQPVVLFVVHGRLMVCSPFHRDHPGPIPASHRIVHLDCIQPHLHILPSFFPTPSHCHAAKEEVLLPTPGQ